MSKSTGNGKGNGRREEVGWGSGRPKSRMDREERKERKRKEER